MQCNVVNRHETIYKNRCTEITLHMFNYGTSPSLLDNLPFGGGGGGGSIPSGASNINPQVYSRLPLTLSPITGLTQTQTALLSPGDQVLAQRLNRNRLT